MSPDPNCPLPGIDIQLKAKPTWRDHARQLGSFVGPGFLVAIAYIDPGNFQSNLASGAQFQYKLLWVLLYASIAGMFVQSLAASLGVVTGKHLAQHCRSEYPPKVNFGLWVLAELAMVASDIPEVIGTAFALHLLVGIPVWAGVLITGFDTLLILCIQHYGFSKLNIYYLASQIRKLEVVIGSLVLVMASCFIIELGYVNPQWGDAAMGLVRPRLPGSEAVLIAVSLVGAVVMPHNLYLHSALVLSRRGGRKLDELKAAERYFRVETTVALCLACVINMSVTVVAATVCTRPDLATEDRERCADLSLDNAFFLLGTTLGAASQKLYGVALLASGQSSTVTGTYAGQHVMSGFLNIQWSPWIRNLVTRCVAIVPSLAVALAAGSSGAGNLIIIASAILSFQLPFALLPLIKFVSSEAKMGPLKKKKALTIIAFFLAVVIFCANSTLLGSFLVDVRHSHGMPRVAKEFITVIAAILAACYITALLYLAIRKDRNVTFPGLDTTLEEVSHVEGEDRTTSRNELEVAVVQPRATPHEDTALTADS
eukprot:jgi/Chlat1/8311/Chrsp78S09214